MSAAGGDEEMAALIKQENAALQAKLDELDRGTAAGAAA